MLKYFSDLDVFVVVDDRTTGQLFGGWLHCSIKRRKGVNDYFT